MRRLAWGPLTIRLRLGLALALMPVLALGAAESVVAFRRDVDERRVALIAAADRSAMVARSRMQGAEVLLETLNPAAIGLQCSPSLAVAMNRSQGFSNLIRLDASARVACAAATVRADPGRFQSGWFQALRAGEVAVITRTPAGVYSAQPSALIAVRASGPDGRFAGALAAAMPLDALRPDLSDPSLPADAQVALADRDGQYLPGTARDAFAPLPAGFASRAAPPGSLGGAPPGAIPHARVFHAADRTGQRRVFAVAPLLRDVSVVISAPDEGLFSWARLNPLSGILLPFAAFALALPIVWVVADRVIVQWLRYLDRIAAIYARGRFTVRPLQAERAPPEVRALADTLDVMAEAIVARDQSLRDSLAQKDALMREIHHRVKNNLQVITSLLNMQQRTLTDPAARAAMSDTRQRIGALALIYRALYQGPDLRRVDLRAFLEELTAQVIASDGGSIPAIRTDLVADALEVDPDKLAPIALFAVEAITNAQKHAFGPHGGVLHVRFTLLEAEGRLEIEDEGGRAEPRVEGAVGDGVGHTLMSAFARQLRGRCEIEPNTRGGITARLVFPAPEAGATAPARPTSRPRGNQAAA